MKSGIHPEYAAAKITCACGRVTETYTTVGEIHVEICSHCHPFFTGKQKLVDTAGRVERFRLKYGEPGRAGKKAKKGGVAKATEDTSAAAVEAAPEPEVAAEPEAAAEAEAAPEKEAAPVAELASEAAEGEESTAAES